MKGKKVLKGRLGFISLAELFQILSGSKCTGTLCLRTPHARASGMIHFVSGHPINARLGGLQGINAIHPLFGWVEGDFEFNEKAVRLPRVIKQSPMQIILDGLKMLDDGQIKPVGPPQGAGLKANGETVPHEKDLLLVQGPLVDYTHIVEEERFRDGTPIVKEGAHGNWIWVIIEGHAQVVRETQKGPVPVAQLGEGCFVGTLASFLHGQNDRSATVTARGEVQLGLLNAQHLSSEFHSLSPDFRSLLLSLDGRLRKVTERMLTLHLRRPTPDKSVQGEVLTLEQGSPEEDLFSIVEGETYVVRRVGKGQMPLLTLEKADIFGYVPFMNMAPEQPLVSMLASKDLKVRKLDTACLQKEHDRLSSTLRNFIFNVGSCVSATTRLVARLQENKDQLSINGHDR